ncbi:glycosyl transferase family protein [Alteromonas sp. 1_MG-2023]|uniref:glycosyl transferase family protein n=1 Tax=Alteromonas sp. 1_MG-2023 TaxID=3062669 RepID=UPI0026E40ADB|nr:glycosyl transferase family protein [Alteromonas sp. 1_MG-2023]MDO6565726.1 glycosyl transferase family protein [Alteromonas sp. 1_MG-2023]
MSQQFSNYIKIIGKGQKGGRSLTRQEAYESMKMVLSNQVTGDQRGAFLMLLRTREETPEEVIGFVDACRELLEPELANLTPTLDVGCYAGKRRQLPWYLLSIAVLANNGYTIMLHGAHEPGSGRLYASKALPALGLPEASNIADASDQMNEYGATYLDLSHLLPALNTLIKLREVFALRSCANTLARLLNPTSAPYCVQGVYHMHLDHKHCRVNESFPAFQALCFRGDGGDPEVNSERKTELYITRNGSTEEIILPELTDKMALKDTQMDVNDMLALWRGESTHLYGEQAIQATLVSYLILLENYDFAKANEVATQMWSQRNKTALPFGPK